MSMFEQAARLALRFNTPKGEATVEDLFNLPLQSNTGKANLDDIAKSLHRELRASGETQSFVTPTEAANTTLQLKFDIVKHVIDTRVAENRAAADAAKRRETKQNLLAVIAKKEGEALESMPLDELKKMAEAL